MIQSLSSQLSLSQPANNHSHGKLYLFPNTLGIQTKQAWSYVIPQDVCDLITSCSYILAENAKAARAYLKALNITQPLMDIVIKEICSDLSLNIIDDLLKPIQAGADAGLVSDAGCPAIADPGANIVRRAHECGIQVIPLVGPSAILLALIASGLNGQNFAFNGYLPIKENARQQSILHFYRRSKLERQTQIFIETPYRNEALLNALLTTLPDETRLVVAVDLTLNHEKIIHQTVKTWQKNIRRNQNFELNRRPAIFMFLA